jgi:hypothetical protein
MVKEKKIAFAISTILHHTITNNSLFFIILIHILRFCFFKQQQNKSHNILTPSNTSKSNKNIVYNNIYELFINIITYRLDF